MAVAKKNAGAKPGKKGKSDHITDISHKEIKTDKEAPEETASPIEVDAEAEELSVEVRSEKEVRRYGKADAGIEALEKAFGNLPAINGVEDKEGYKKTHEAWQKVRAARLGFQKKHTEIKADYLIITRAIDGEKNRLVDKITPLETKLGDELDRIDNIKKEEAVRIEREAQEKLQGRVAELIANGCQFNGTYYAIGDTITMDVVVLGSMDDAIYTEFIGKVKSENAKIIKAKEEQEAKAKKDAEELEQLREQAKQMKEERRKGRVTALELLGFVWSFKRNAWIYSKTDFGDAMPVLAVSDLADLPADEWETFHEQAKQMKTDIDTKQADQDKKTAERATLQSQRLNALQPYANYGRGYAVSTLCDMSEDEFNFLLADKKQAFETSKREEKERKEKEALITLRAQQLRDLFGMVPDLESGFIRRSAHIEVPAMRVEGRYLSEVTDQEWAILIESQKLELKNVLEAEQAAQRVIDEKAEADRLALLSEKEQVEEYLHAVVAVKQPKVKNDVLLELLTRLDGEIDEIRQAIKDME